MSIEDNFKSLEAIGYLFLFIGFIMFLILMVLIRSIFH